MGDGNLGDPSEASREKGPLLEGCTPTPGCFLQKSPDLLEKKRVEVFVSAKEFGRVSNETG
jgi:hypothetical protein